MLDQTTLDKMIAAARLAMSRAHAPVSGFPVGAALLTASGEIFPGCNTESIIAGLGTCAERSAVDHAVIHGFKDFAAILIVSTKPDPLYPCGACRQYLFEFAQQYGNEIMVYSLGAEGVLDVQPLEQLLPNGFGPKNK